MYTHVLNTLVPVFLVIALGAALRKTNFLTDEVLRGANKLAFWVGLPALLFIEIAGAKQFGGAPKVFAMGVAGTIGCVAVCLIFAFTLRMPAARIGSFIQAGFRGNLAFVGLAVVKYAFAGRGDGGSSAEAMAALAIGGIIPLFNVLAVIVLLASKHKLGLSAFKKMTLSIVTNPLLISCVLGMLWLRTGQALPLALNDTLKVVGQFALPVALLAVGGALVTTKLSGNVLYSTLAGAIKVGIAPLAGYVVARLLGASPAETAIGMILCACPTAVVSYVMAEQLDGDGPMTAGAIVISTVLSVISLAVAVAMV